MSNPDIRRYERELRSTVKGFRRRRRVLEAFRRSLSLFLEDVDAPTYEALEEAFGPPEQMAEALIEAIPDLPKPLLRRQKIGIFVSCCLLIMIVCLGVFYFRNMPEAGVIASDEATYTEELLRLNYGSRMDSVFNQRDFSWKQGKEYKGYLIFFKNTNQVDTVISVKYSDYQSPHTIVVPAGEQRTLQVENARPTEHVISFDTSDGSMSGTVQVFLRLPS